MGRTKNQITSNPAQHQFVSELPAVRWEADNEPCTDSRPTGESGWTCGASSTRTKLCGWPHEIVWQSQTGLSYQNCEKLWFCRFGDYCRCVAFKLSRLSCKRNLNMNVPHSGTACPSLSMGWRFHGVISPQHLASENVTDSSGGKRDGKSSEQSYHH